VSGSTEHSSSDLSSPSVHEMSSGSVGAAAVPVVASTTAERLETIVEDEELAECVHVIIIVTVIIQQPHRHL